jgi:hypothetical protein
VITAEHICCRNKQAKHIGQRLPIAADHVVSNIGQTD